MRNAFRKSAILASIIVFGVVPGTYAQSLKPTNIPAIGPWQIMKMVDPMTDKADCAAIHADYRNIQLSDNAIYIGMRGQGGVKAYKLRIDEAPARELQLANATEKRASILVVGNGRDGVNLANVKRVRVQILTVLDDSKVYDLDVSNFSELMAAMSTTPCK